MMRSLPGPLARGLARALRRTVPGMAVVVATTAPVLVAAALIAQERAEYRPRAQPGALEIHGYEPGWEQRARAALKQVIPVEPIVESAFAGGNPFAGVVPVDDGVSITVGDRRLLHYLAEDPRTPYDPGAVIALNVPPTRWQSLDVSSWRPMLDRKRSVAVPVVAARSKGGRGTLFVPAELALSLGQRSEPRTLIIDPALHRTTRAEQDRLDELLDVSAESYEDWSTGIRTYVERGYRPSAAWAVVICALALAGLPLGAVVLALRAPGRL